MHNWMITIPTTTTHSHTCINYYVREKREDFIQYIVREINKKEKMISGAFFFSFLTENECSYVDLVA